jgi:hypothetical protein
MLPEIRLRASTVVPPMVLPLAVPPRKIPVLFGRAAVPAAFEEEKSSSTPTKDTRREDRGVRVLLSHLGPSWNACRETTCARGSKVHFELVLSENSAG